MEKRGKMFNKSLAVIVGLGVWAACIFVTPNPAQALPAFARQYKVECATCHTQYPERNTFGEAFERNGFIWPGDKKPKMSHKGSEGLMLSGIPEGVPLSIFAEISTTYNPNNTSDGNGPNVDYSNNEEVEFFGAGNFKEEVGYMTHIVFGDSEANIEQAWLEFKDPMGIPIDIKFGKFRPTLSPLSLHYSAGVSGITYDDEKIVSSEPFSPRTKEPGVELTKVFANGHLFAAAGLINGKNNDNANNNSVEPYGHLSWRIMGTDLSGNQPDISLDAAESFTDYLTLTLSGWGISGSQVNTSRDYYRAGIDAEAIYKAWRLRLSTSIGSEDDPDPALTALTSMDLQTYHALVEYTINSKWLVGAAYNHLDVDELDATTNDYPQSTWSLNASHLVYQNLKLAIGYIHEDAEQDTTNDLVELTAFFAF